MFSLEDKIGTIVIESVPVQINDIGITPLVIGMTLFALLFQCQHVATMKTLF